MFAQRDKGITSGSIRNLIACKAIAFTSLPPTPGRGWFWREMLEEFLRNIFVVLTFEVKVKAIRSASHT